MSLDLFYEVVRHYQKACEETDIIVHEALMNEYYVCITLEHGNKFHRDYWNYDVLAGLEDMKSSVERSLVRAYLGFISEEPVV